MTRPSPSSASFRRFDSSGVGVMLIVLASLLRAGPAPLAPIVTSGPDGRLVYHVDELGNRVPDFSHAGYGGGGVPIPEVPSRVIVHPGPGDDGSRIQAAIDHVSTLAPDAEGLRGAVLLAKGRFEVSGDLRLQASGVVLRGSGRGTNGTLLVATGIGRRALIQIRGVDDLRTNGRPRNVLGDYTPVNARVLELDSVEGLDAGDRVVIQRPSPGNWVDFVGMGSVPGRPAPSWRTDQMNVNWERRIEAIDGSRVTVDAPLTCALESRFGGAQVIAVSWPGRIGQVGIEHLRCESEWDRNNPRDEEHAWMAVMMENVEDAWVRQVSVEHFVSSAVDLGHSCRRVTVEDCESLAPVSELGGYRRHSFYTAGQQTLFLRCRAEEGRHDFAVGWLAAGPNAFVQCEARRAHGFSGPIESWATGALYDNLVMDGGGIRFDNRELWDNGVGWAAANCLAWNCPAPVIVARKPPGANNWVVGCWGQFVGDATWRSPNSYVKPDSLYTAQLRERVGSGAARVLDESRIAMEFDGVPTIDELLRIKPSLMAAPSAETLRPLVLTNGWLVVGGRLLIGAQAPVTWWRGHIQPERAPAFGVNLTRFVPGRSGFGLTDDLSELAAALALDGHAALRHHWGLWYDRRRDDHQMIRRIDGEVWPPFYEMPWARSGKGRAWDGLSRYDLTRFNPWYFGRVREFAIRSARRGLCLVDNMYFQHNILEAGAHWADFPWRPVNNVNQTGFPEPPPYVNRKRIFMADAFYDTTHAVRASLHRDYIRHCLDNLADQPNVIHLTGEEYSGPLEFVQFWLDTIAEWKRDHARAPSASRPLVGLSAPKDVQDAILEDPARAGLIDVIDFKYWWRSPKGVFAPDGGQNLAPRQHERQWKGGRPTDETLAQMAGAYRKIYPDKAIITGFDRSGWAYVCAGGSLPNLPSGTDPDLLEAIPRMAPWHADAENKHWSLRQPDGDCLIYTGGGLEVRVDLMGETGDYAVFSVSSSGTVVPAGDPVRGGRVVALVKAAEGPAVFWLKKR